MRISDWSSDVCSSDLHQDLTLTRLYNVLEALKEGRPLTEAERDIHDRGLVTLICQHHDTIDALVAEAYGWPANLSDAEVLTRLVALNTQRAAEEAKGLIRWLAPEFQAPDSTENGSSAVGQGVGSTCRSRWEPHTYTKKLYLHNLN